MSQPEPEHVLRLHDRAAISDALARYARGVDRRDWSLVRSAYHPDATDDHGSYSGPLDGFIAFLERRHATITQSIHVLGTMVFEFVDDDRALVETYFICHQRLEGGGTASTSPATAVAVENESIGRYLDVFERRSGDWRIASRTVVFDRYGSRPAEMGGKLSSMRNVSRRDGGDALHAVRRSLGLA